MIGSGDRSWIVLSLFVLCMSGALVYQSVMATRSRKVSFNDIADLILQLMRFQSYSVKGVHCDWRVWVLGTTYGRRASSAWLQGQCF